MATSVGYIWNPEQNGFNLLLKSNDGHIRIATQYKFDLPTTFSHEPLIDAEDRSGESLEEENCDLRLAVGM